jgi:hypothetical protein
MVVASKESSEKTLHMYFHDYIRIESNVEKLSQNQSGVDFADQFGQKIFWVIL